MQQISFSVELIEIFPEFFPPFFPLSKLNSVCKKEALLWKKKQNKNPPPQKTKQKPTNMGSFETDRIP